MMRFEHDQHGEALNHLENLTQDITEPENACNTWRALYAGLRQLREDLMQHIHLENIFFSPKDRRKKMKRLSRRERSFPHPQRQLRFAY